MKLGAVPVPVSEVLSADEYAFVLNDSRARAVVAGEGAAEAILSVRAQCPWLAAVIAVCIASPSPPISAKPPS